MVKQFKEYLKESGYPAQMDADLDAMGNMSLKDPSQRVSVAQKMAQELGQKIADALGQGIYIDIHTKDKKFQVETFRKPKGN